MFDCQRQVSQVQDLDFFQLTKLPGAFGHFKSDRNRFGVRIAKVPAYISVYTLIFYD